MNDQTPAAANVTPISALARQLDAPPIAGAANPPPGAGLDPDVGGGSGGDLPPADTGGAGPSSGRPRGEIWKGCPVRPLGYLGATYFYLDPLGQLRGITKHDAQAIMMLFAAKLPRLYQAFPKMVSAGKDGGVYRKPEHFEHQLACSAMITACGERGLFNPEGAVRGVGAWTDEDGQLIYHTGDSLLIGAEALEPNLHQGKIYPAYPPIPHPAPATKDSGPANDLVDTFGSWNWTRPDIDPMLCLGMVGVQMLGGALSWRPTFWNTGSRASGKSSFQTLLKHLHGPGLIQSTDATKSGITSRIGHSSLPVALDELEPGDEGSGKEKAIIELARVASSGGEWMRGSSDQKGASGNVYSSFFFSSILIPGALKSQDVSRLIILSLQALPEGTPPLNLRAETWRKRGAALKRLLINRWPSWQARLDLWREAFAEHKITGRDADNYATTLAMGQMALSDAMPSADELSGWAAKVARHVKTQVDEIGSDADEVVTHLLSQQFDPFRRGERQTIAAWVKAAGHRPRSGRRLFGSTSDGADHSGSYAEDAQTLADYAKRANASLASLGIRVIGTPEAPVLFVATKQLQGMKDLFGRSQWAGGAWTQSLCRIKGARANCGPRYLDGHQTKGTEVPFSSMPGLLAFDGDEVVMPAPVTAAEHRIDIEDSY
jgi:hypothetical protein